MSSRGPGDNYDPMDDDGDPEDDYEFEYEPEEDEAKDYTQWLN